MTSNTEDSQEKGMALFLDIFRRADKDDDGALCWAEFKNFFADGVLSGEELEKLFHDIDTHNTNYIDTGELCSFFSDHLGSFRQVLESVEDLNKSVANMLHASAAEYSNADMIGQFLTRFLLQQTQSELSAIQRPLDAASDALEEQTLAARGHTPQMAVTGTEAGSADAAEARSPTAVLPGRYGRRFRKGYTTQVSWPMESPASLMSGNQNLQQQVDRLRCLLDRFEKKVKLEGGPEEQVDIQDEIMVKVVSRRLRVNADREKSFRSALRAYIESTNEDSSCLHLSVRSYAGSHCYVIYEVWDGEDHWRSHVASDKHKSFQHSNVDCLELPEQLQSMDIPSSWWKHD